MDAKDWIILRLMRAIAKGTASRNHPDFQKTCLWMANTPLLAHMGTHLDPVYLLEQEDAQARESIKEPA